MQEEISSKTVSLIIETGKLTTHVLQKAIRESYHLSKNIKEHTPKGKQSLSKLKAQGVTLVYYIADYTKNEKGISQDGRLFPITDELLKLLNETRLAQKQAGLDTEFVFGRINGKPMNIHAYTRFLRRICEKVGLSITNNHAFRMALNSNVFIPNGIPETVRAQIIGHSVETNLSYYSYAQRDYLVSTREKLNATQNRNGGVSTKMEEFEVIPFTKRKSPQTLSLKAFS
ncbi:MAG: tyrosine-type recombinase/integrase [Lachnospiraceae bacterium]|nr:tyrosine-type recombinase/integrase [Lachnospiraceae bacterium]